MACAKIGLLAQRLIVMVIDQYGPAPRGVPAINIPPPVTNHPASLEVNIQFARRAPQHSWVWLPTVAVRIAPARVKTNFHSIKGQFPAHVFVNPIDDLTLQRSAPHIWLIGRDDEEKPSLLELAAGVRDAGENQELVDGGGRVGFARNDFALIDHTIAIEEHRCIFGRRGHKTVFSWPE